MCYVIVLTISLKKMGQSIKYNPYIRISRSKTRFINQTNWVTTPYIHTSYNSKTVYQASKQILWHFKENSGPGIRFNHNVWISKSKRYYKSIKMNGKVTAFGLQSPLMMVKQCVMSHSNRFDGSGKKLT